MNNSALDSLFFPKGIAVIGAKDTPAQSVGATVMRNLLEGGFLGKIYPVNPNRDAVCGLKCFSAVTHIAEPIDLAIIVVPAPVVPKVLEECCHANISSAIILSSGFKEMGPEGTALEERVKKISLEGGVRIVGPNCLGIMNPRIHLNASFARGQALSGSIAFISQSGAMCSAVLDWSLAHNIGFSGFASIGSMADIGWAECIRYFGNDPETKTILLYMETVGDSRAFLLAAEEVSHTKPIIVIKPGRSTEGARAAVSHTGSLVGSDAVFDIAIQRAGIMRVDTIEELFDMAEIRSRLNNLQGPALAIVTNAGGPAVLATDSAVTYGAVIGKLEEKTIHALNTVLPTTWSHGNPVDILGDADSSRYEQAIKIVSEDLNVHGVLVIITPQEMTDCENIARVLSQLQLKKHLLVSFMGALSVEGARKMLDVAHIAEFEYPDEAARSFAIAWKYEESLKKYSHSLAVHHHSKRKNEAKKIIDKVLCQGRHVLTERESKNILKCYDIPIVEPFLVKTKEEACFLAEKIGYPVVLKIESVQVTHKSDVQGVFLDRKNSQEVMEAFCSLEKNHFDGITVQKMITAKGVELIAGSYTDAQFGSVLLFGAGGVYVEVFKDMVLGLPPLTSLLAHEMIIKTKISQALRPFRGRENIPLEPIENLLVSLGELVLDLPEIAEIDINPIIAAPNGVQALDSRMILG